MKVYCAECLQPQRTIDHEAECCLYCGNESLLTKTLDGKWRPVDLGAEISTYLATH